MLAVTGMVSVKRANGHKDGGLVAILDASLFWMLSISQLAPVMDSPTTHATGGEKHPQHRSGKNLTNLNQKLSAELLQAPPNDSPLLQGDGRFQ